MNKQLMSNPSSYRYSSFESIRGWMALWVFVTHYSTMAGFSVEKGIGIGRIVADGKYAVAVFILLSGFLIANILKKGNLEYSQFILRRSFRIFPAYLVFLLVSSLTLFFAVDALEMNPWKNSKIIERIAYFSESKENFIPHLFFHLPLLHGLLPDGILPYAEIAIMGVAWSLSLEWQFYLVAPFLYVRIINKRNVIICLAILVCLILWRHYNHSSAYLGNNLILFGLGGLSVIVLTIPDNSRRNYLSVILFVIGFILTFRDYMFAWIIWMLVIWAEMGWSIPKQMRRIWDLPYLRILGNWSYSFYCCHFSILMMCSWGLLKWIPSATQLQYAFLLLVISLPMTIATSRLSYRFIEIPWIEKAKFLTKPAKLANE